MSLRLLNRTFKKNKTGLKNVTVNHFKSLYKTISIFVNINMNMNKQNLMKHVKCTKARKSTARKIKQKQPNIQKIQKMIRKKKNKNIN